MARPDEYKGRWNHWAFTKNAATGKMIIYLNGAVWLQATGKKRPLTAAASFSLGNKADRQRPYAGMAAELRVWNRERSQKEIWTDMHRRMTGTEPGLAAYWPLDGGPVAFALDGLVHKIGKPTKITDGALKGPAWTTAPESPWHSCQAAVTVAEFDGQQGSITIGKADYLNTPTALTVEVWVNPGDKEQDLKAQPVVSRQGLDTGWEVQCGKKGAAFLLYTGTAPSTVSVSTPLQAGLWYHLTGVYDGQQQRLYVNGVLKAQKATTGQIKPYLSALTIGCNAHDKTICFQGQVAEVRVWKAARTLAQIHQHMHRSLAGDEADLVGYWRLDETYNALALDASIFGMHGSLHNVYRSVSHVPIAGRAAASEQDRKRNVKTLWSRRDDVNEQLQAARAGQVSLKNVIVTLQTQQKQAAAQLKSQQTQYTKLKAAKEAQVKALTAENLKLEQGEGDDLIAIDEFISKTKEQIKRAREEMTQEGAGYQLQDVHMSLRYLPGNKGLGLRFPQDMSTIGADQLSTIEVTFSSGDQVKQVAAAMRAVPELSGLTEVMARRKLTAAGFLTKVSAQAVEPSATSVFQQANRVVNQNPKPGQSIAIGSTVTLFIGLES